MFPSIVVILIICQTGFGYTNNDFCMGEAAYQDVCESQARHVENDYEIGTKFPHLKYNPMTKHQSVLSRYHSGTENSRIYRERSPSKDEQSYDFYVNQPTYKDRSQARSSYNRRINELYNRGSEHAKARDLSRQRVDISRHRNANEMLESASRPSYTTDATNRMARDLSFNGVREERGQRYKYGLEKSQNTAYGTTKTTSDQTDTHFTVERRESRSQIPISSTQNRMDSRRSMKSRGNVRPEEHRVSRFVDNDRDQTRATNVRRNSVDSRRKEVQKLQLEPIVERHFRTPVENNRRMETRQHESERRERVPAGDAESINRYVKRHDRLSTDQRRPMVNLKHRVQSNDLTPSDSNGELMENSERNHHRILDDKQAESRDRIVYRSRERKVDRREQRLVDNARRRETHEKGLESRERMLGDRSHRVATRNGNVDTRVSANDNHRMLSERRVESKRQMLTFNDIHHNSDIGIRDRMSGDENGQRIETRMDAKHSAERRKEGRMSGRRERSVARYNRMPENNYVFHNEIQNSNQRINVNRNRAESRDRILVDDSRSDRERRSFDIVRGNIGNRDHGIDVSQRHRDHSDMYAVANDRRQGTSVESRNVRSSDIENSVIQMRRRQRENTARVGERQERQYRGNLKASVVQTGNQDLVSHSSTPQESLVKDSTNLFDKYRLNNYATSMDRKQVTLKDEAYKAYNMLIDTMKTLLIGLLVIQLIDFRRNEKLLERSFFGRYTLSHILSKKVG